MLVHFCSSWWRLESSESGWLNSEGSLQVPLSHAQVVEEHLLQLSREQTPAITSKSPAPQSATGQTKASAHAWGVARRRGPNSGCGVRGGA